METNTYSKAIEELISEHSHEAVYLSLPCPPPAPIQRIGKSKFGGRPNLPSELEWPRGMDPYDKTNKEFADSNVMRPAGLERPKQTLFQRIFGKKPEIQTRYETVKVLQTKRGPSSEHKPEPAPPLHFLAQIDCSDLPPSQAQLPKAGALFFFARMDDEAVWDHDDDAASAGVCVLYSKTGLGGIPEREPPDDTWQIHNRHIPSLGATGKYRDERLTTKISDKQVFPEWPVEFHLYTHIVDSGALQDHLPSRVKDEDKYDFWETFDDVRQDRIKSTLPTVTSDEVTTVETAQTSSEKQQNTPWHCLPEPLKDTLSDLAIYVTEVAAHIGAAASEVPVDLKRKNKTEFNSEAIDLAHTILQEAEAWIDRVEGFSPSDGVPTAMAKDFLAWMDDLAEAQYIYRVKTTDEGEEQKTYLPLLKLGAPHFHALEEIARRSARDQELYEKTPEALYQYCRFTNDFPADNHQMLGHFRSCQNEFALASDNVHLLRLNSADMLNWCFWDVGEATFFIKATDLAASRFNKAWASIQG